MADILHHYNLVSLRLCALISASPFCQKATLLLAKYYLTHSVLGGLHLHNSRYCFSVVVIVLYSVSLVYQQSLNLSAASQHGDVLLGVWMRVPQSSYRSANQELFRGLRALFLGERCGALC